MPGESVTTDEPDPRRDPVRKVDSDPWLRGAADLMAPRERGLLRTPVVELALGRARRIDGDRGARRAEDWPTAGRARPTERLVVPTLRLTDGVPPDRVARRGLDRPPLLALPMREELDRAAWVRGLERLEERFAT